MVGRMRQPWQITAAALTASVFVLGGILPVATGVFVTHLPSFGAFAGELHAFSWGLAGAGYADAVPWVRLDVPVWHALGFTLWWLTPILTTGAAINGVQEATRRHLLLAAAACAVLAPLMHVVGLRAWLGAVTPGLGLVFQGATGLGLVLLAWRVPAPLGRREATAV